MLERRMRSRGNRVKLQPIEAGNLFPLKLDRVVLERGGQRRLNGITAEIGKPGITLIMGPNGAGKSLLIKLLHALDQPTAGRILWGETLAGAQTRRRQAMVFQRPVLLRRSVAANLDFAIGLRDKDGASKSNQRLNFRDRLLARVKLAGVQRQAARQLSGGEQQRLALARALATRPDVLLLDEPTANLDPASTKIIEDIVRDEHRAGTKIIFVSHDLAQARRLADQVLFLHRGRLEEQQNAERFFSHPQTTAARDYLAGRIIL